MADVVVARGLRKAFGSRAALDGLDLTVAAGTVHGLLGPNGAGKTTLLRVLLGLVRLDAGELEVAGRLRGFVEQPGAYPYLTGRENLQIIADVDGLDRDVDPLLEAVGLLDRADDRVRGWSLGQRQRLALAAGLLGRPSVLVLDEPANGLDPRGAADLRMLLRELADDGLTVLVSSHDLADVSAVCDAVTVVVRGRAVWSGGIAELTARPGAFVLATSDDAAAVTVPAPGLDVSPHPAGHLQVHGAAADVEAFVLRLAQQAIAVRRLHPADVPLDQAFLELTA